MPRKEPNPDEEPLPEITGSLGTGKQSTSPSVEEILKFNSGHLVLTIKNITSSEFVIGALGAGKTKPPKRSKKKQGPK